MRLERTNAFKQDYKNLPKNVQETTDNKIRFLVSNIRHPSLRVKKVRKHKDVFEATVTRSYRILFKIVSGGYILLRVGAHDILEKR